MKKESYPTNYEKARPFQSTQKNFGIIMKWSSLHKKEFGTFPLKNVTLTFGITFFKKRKKS